LPVITYEGHLEKLEGGYTFAFERYTADADLTPFFAGLPETAARRRTGGDARLDHTPIG
jgi:hypothetical protein